MGIFRRLRRSSVLKEGLMPDDSWASLLEEHPILDGLTEAELATLRETVTLFLHEKTFEGADGLDLTDFMRSVISVQACLPILHLGLETYENWKTIVVVPDVFVQEHAETDRAGVAHEWEEDGSGESWDEGPVVLSWKDVEESGWGDGYNVVIHEAAHRLDLLDGEVNGRPALPPGMSPTEWKEVFSRAFEEMGRHSRRRRRRPRIDPYALESDSEFFAVASEYFFEQPAVLKAEQAEVYRLLSAFYRQDPAARLKDRRRR
jgi:Mlc titration factor MtfA (ptsG expression regulator)